MHVLHEQAADRFFLLTRLRILNVLAALCAFSCRGPQGPVGPPGQGGGDLVNPAIQPRVIYTNPPADRVGPYDDFVRDITIRFNKAMDVASVRKALTVQDADGDSLSLVYFTTAGGDVFTFSLETSPGNVLYASRIRCGASYTIHVSSEARDINGNALVPPFQMTLVPEPRFRLRETYPLNGEQEVDACCWADGFIYLYFNSPIDSKDVSLLHLAPPVHGIWRYETLVDWGTGTGIIDSTLLVFSPLEDLLESQVYTLAIPDSFSDVRGNRLGEPSVLMFRTATFRVTSIAPPDGATGISLYPGGSHIEVRTNAQLDTGSIRSSFRIEPAADGGVVWTSPWASGFEFASERGFAPETRYTLTISESLRTSHGVLLDGQYTSSFTTDSFYLGYRYPRDGDTVSASTGWFTFAFSALLDTGSIASAFTVSPPLAGTLRYSALTNGFDFHVGEPLQPGTDYAITISTALKTQSGYPLRRPYSMWFAVRP